MITFLRRPAWLLGLLLLAPLGLTACQTQTLGQASQATAAQEDRVAPTAEEQRSLERLLALIDERLAVAPLVAEAKWNSGAPIDDPAREAQILDGVTRSAAEAGVSEDFARAFFQAQFDASKVYQEALHAAWRAEDRPPFENAPDLGRDVRPVLDRLTPELIEVLREVEAIEPGMPAERFLLNRGEIVIRGDIDGRPRATALQPVSDLLRG